MCRQSKDNQFGGNFLRQLKNTVEKVLHVGQKKKEFPLPDVSPIITFRNETLVEDMDGQKIGENETDANAALVMNGCIKQENVEREEADSVNETGTGLADNVQLTDCETAGKILLPDLPQNENVPDESDTLEVPVLLTGENTQTGTEYLEDCDRGEFVLEQNAPISAEPEKKPEPEPSLLDNRYYVKLLESLFRLDDELERIAAKAPTDPEALIEHIRGRLDEMFERMDLTEITGETSFDVRRHQSVPVSLVPDGTEITETVQSGWALERRVFRRAKVVVANRKEEEH